MSASRIPSETRTARMESVARLPVVFGLAGKRAVVAGGSPAAAWKAELLAAAGGKVEVFAADVSEELRAVATEQPRSEQSDHVIDAVVIHARGWQAADLAGAAIAVGAFATHGQARALAPPPRAPGLPR